MKTLTRILCIAAVTTIAAIPALAQTNSQARIRQLIRVYHVPNPNVATGEVLIDPDQFLSSSIVGFGEPRNAPFHSLLNRLWGPANNREAIALQTVVSEIVGIRGRLIAVYLVDDSAATLTPTAATSHWGISLSSGHVWPSGLAFATQGQGPHATAPARAGGGVFHGSFTMGNWHLLNTAGFQNNVDQVAATFCHELMHTQDLIDWRTHIPGLGTLYGSSGAGHLFHGVIPNFAMAYAEGLANFAGLRYAMAAQHATSYSPDLAMRWFTNNESLFVETAPRYGDLHTRMRNIPSTGQTNQAGTTWNMYPVRSVPADVRIHNELVIALILHHYATHVGFHRTMQTVARVNPQNYLVSTIPLSNLIGGLVNDATGDLRLLPIALVDYFTSYTAGTPNDMRTILEGPLTGSANAEIDRYYSTLGNAIRQRTGSPQIDPANPTTADVINIASRLGVRATPRD